MERIKEIVSGYYADLSELIEALNKERFFVTDANLEKVDVVFYKSWITSKIKYTIKLHWINGETMMIYPDDITKEEID